MNSPAPNVSVVIPALNREATIERAIRSATEQDCPFPFEIIVVDNGSVDRTVEKAKAFPNVIVIEESKQGVSAARNTGIRKSVGRYIALLDSDDVMLPGRLLRQYSFLEERPDIELCSSTVGLQSDLSLVYSSLAVDWSGWKVLDNSYEELLCSGGEVINTMTAFFRREAFFEVGQFDEGLFCGEDTNLWLQFAKRRNFAIYSEPLAIKNDLEDNKLTKSKFVYLDGPMVITRELAQRPKLSKRNLKQARLVGKRGVRMMMGYIWRNGLKEEYASRRDLIRSAYGDSFVAIWDLMMKTPPFVGRFLHSLKLKLRHR